MSVENMALVLHHSQAFGAAKLVLLGIANHQGDGGAWCSVATLAKYAAVSERRVQQILSELEAAGELVRKLQAAGYGGSKTNLYWVNIACPDDCDGTSNHRTQGRSPLHPRGEAHFTPGAKPASPKPSLEPSVEPIYAQDEPERAPESFDEFWRTYPRKVGKRSAQKAYALAVARASVEAVTAGARRLANDPNLPPLQYVPHPATWLNRDGWEDEAYAEREETAEEREARLLAESARRREVERQHSERLHRESEEAAANAAPPPTCIHGGTVVACRTCVAEIKNGADPDTLIAP